MKFSSWSNQSFLAVVLGAAIVAVTLCAAIEWWAVSDLRGAFANARRGHALAEAAATMHDDVLQLRRYEKDVFLNIGSPERRADYRARWDRAMLQLRYDLQRVRAVRQGTSDAQVQYIADSIAQYREAFAHTYDLVQGGSVLTGQQANDEMARNKSSIHQAENLLVQLEREAQAHMSSIENPVGDLQWTTLGLNLMLLGIVCGPLAYALRRQPSTAA